jgi:hypothetical protein
MGFRNIKLSFNGEVGISPLPELDSLSKINFNVGT